jgi:uncharacterized membrane protein
MKKAPLLALALAAVIGMASSAAMAQAINVSGGGSTVQIDGNGGVKINGGGSTVKVDGKGGTDINGGGSTIHVDGTDTTKDTLKNKMSQKMKSELTTSIIAADCSTQAKLEKCYGVAKVAEDVENDNTAILLPMGICDQLEDGSLQPEDQ